MDACISFIFTLIHHLFVFCHICMPSLPFSLFTQACTRTHTRFCFAEPFKSVRHHDTLLLIFNPKSSAAFPKINILLHNYKTIVITKRFKSSTIIPSTPQGITINSVMPSTIQFLLIFPPMSPK